MAYRDFHDDELGLRDHLALDRTVLANERTVLAYVRTALMLVVSAISLLKLFPENALARWTGIGLMPLAVMISVLGFWRYFALSRSLVDCKRR
jgi:putative membrane protein